MEWIVIWKDDNGDYVVEYNRRLFTESQARKRVEVLHPARAPRAVRVIDLAAEEVKDRLVVCLGDYNEDHDGMSHYYVATRQLMTETEARKYVKTICQERKPLIVRANIDWNLRT